MDSIDKQHVDQMDNGVFYFNGFPFSKNRMGLMMINV